MYAKAVIVVATLIAGSASLFMRAVTADVQAEIRDVREDLRLRAAADSIRFERVVEVVEFAVIAIVEPAGSDERAAAIGELRRRRHVTVSIP
jgi:hypothetical protein